MLITWGIDPNMIELGPVTIRWYGFFFAMAFLFGTLIMSKIMQLEDKPAKSVDRLLIYMLLAIVFGARLGEVLFYNPSFFLENPFEVFKVWKGGLASHGAVIGILVSLYIYSRNTPGQSYLWILDRIVIIVALGGSMIRVGNFFNSEILGSPTGSDFGVIFTRIDMIPRHPAQLYESFTYLTLFFILVYLYKKADFTPKPGQLVGLFLTVAFTARFLIEFVKRNQVAFEEGLILNMGQILSIPVVVLGLFLLIRSRSKNQQD